MQITAAVFRRRPRVKCNGLDKIAHIACKKELLEETQSFFARYADGFCNCVSLRAGSSFLLSFPAKSLLAGYNCANVFGLTLLNHSHIKFIKFDIEQFYDTKYTFTAQNEHWNIRRKILIMSAQRTKIRYRPNHWIWEYNFVTNDGSNYYSDHWSGRWLPPLMVKNVLHDENF